EPRGSHGTGCGKVSTAQQCRSLRASGMRLQSPHAPHGGFAMISQTRRVAVLGGARIPFCKRDTAYADLGNFGMSVAVLGALVEKFGLHGVELGEVAFGSVMKDPADWNLAREALQSSGLAMTTPGFTTARACGTSL